MKSCLIFSAGDYPDEFPNISFDYCIAADAGLKYAEHFGVSPDLILGDFDSLGFVPEGKNVEACSPIKDDTDTALAVRQALCEDCDTIYIIGSLGGRLDHSIANIQLMNDLASRGTQCYLIGRDCIMTAASGEALCFARGFRGVISVFAMSDGVRNVTIKGLKYELTEAKLSPYLPLGVSNEFLDKSGQIEVKNGVLTIFWEKQREFILPERKKL